MKKLKIGVVGCGLIASKRHIPAFHKLKTKAVITAVCDLNIELAKKVAREFGIAHAYSNLTEMLSKESIDVIDVCTPPKIHGQIAIESMESGCHVLMEKPMALKVSDCDEMMKVSNKKNVKLSIVHNMIFYPPFLKAKKLVKEGIIGDLIGMVMLLSTPRHDFPSLENHWVHRLPGGMIGETGPHAVYTTLAFLRNIKNVDVRARKISEKPWILFDDYRVTLEGESATSSIILTYNSDNWRAYMEILGTESMLHLDLESMLLIHYSRRDLNYKTLGLSSLRMASQLVGGIMLNSAKALFGKTMLGHDIMIEKFVNNIINDQPVPVPAEEGKETVRVMEMIVNKLNSRTMS